jgi:hypothetical protein
MKIADSLQLCPSPVTAAEVSAALPLVIPSGLRISYKLHQSTATYAAFYGKPHEVLPTPRSLTGNPEGAEGPAVRLS